MPLRFPARAIGLSFLKRPAAAGPVVVEGAVLELSNITKNLYQVP